MQNNPREFSTWNCDGEIVHDPNIFVKSHKKLVPVFARFVNQYQYLDKFYTTDFFHIIEAFTTQSLQILSRIMKKTLTFKALFQKFKKKAIKLLNVI